jgi:nucleoside 2-deoxyribosyltransferase
MKVYFAHPCFTLEQEEFKKLFVTKLRPLLEGTGVEVVDPFDCAPNVEDDLEEKVRLSKHIVQECLGLLDECDLVLALVDGDDTGTAFEAGCAFSVGKPIILISQGSCSSANAMLLGAAKDTIDQVLERMEDLAARLRWYLSQK